LIFIGAVGGTGANQGTFARSGIEEIVIPDTVVHMGGTVVRNAAGEVVEVAAVANRASVAAADNAGVFDGALNLRSVVLPGGLQTIGSRTFNNTPSLRHITYHGRAYYLETGWCEYVCECTAECDYVCVGRGFCEYICECAAECTHICNDACYCDSWTFKNRLPKSLRHLAIDLFRLSGIRQLDISGAIRIEANAFRYSALRDIELNEGFRWAGADLFRGTNYLQSIILPKTLGIPADGEGAATADIGANMFHSSAVQSIEVLGAVLGANMFQNSVYLSNVVLNEGIIALPASTFADTRMLQEIVLPEGLTAIGANAFERSNIERIVLPSTLESIAANAFRHTRNLRQITYTGRDYTDARRECQYICRCKCDCINECDEYCKVLCTHICLGDGQCIYFGYGSALPYGLLTIGATAFAGYFTGTANNLVAEYGTGSAIRSIVLPASMTTYASNLFAGSLVEYVTILSDAPLAATDMFNGSLSMQSIYVLGDVRTLGTGTFRGSAVREIILPCNLSIVGIYSFAHTPNLDRIFLPEGVEVRDRVFIGWTSNQTIYVATSHYFALITWTFNNASRLGASSMSWDTDSNANVVWNFNWAHAPWLIEYCECEECADD